MIALDTRDDRFDGISSPPGRVRQGVSVGPQSYGYGRMSGHCSNVSWGNPLAKGEADRGVP